MIPIKTRQKFKCDFCNHKLTKSMMERHEKVCFKNPNRTCECMETGIVKRINFNGSICIEECPACIRSKDSGGKHFLKGKIRL